MSKRQDPGQKREPLGDRVRALLTKLEMTQTQLAADADIAPAGLSRILSSGDDRRDPTMAHVLAMAPVLKVTVAELVGGTDAEDVLEVWVPKDRYVESERARLESQDALDRARTELSSRDSEVALLRSRVATLGDEKGKLETTLAQQRGELELGRQHGQQLKKVQADYELLRAENEGLRRKAAEFEAKLQQSQGYGTNMTLAYQAAEQRLADVRQQLVASKNSVVGATALGALLGGVFGGVVVSAITSDTGTTKKRRA